MLKLGFNTPDDAGVFVSSTGLIWEYKLFHDVNAKTASLIAFEYKSGRFVQDIIEHKGASYSPTIESFLNDYSQQLVYE